MNINSIKNYSIFFHKYTVHGNKTDWTPFFKIPPKKCSFVCSDCKEAVWNANNFAGDVHFCTNKEYTFDVTKYSVVKKNIDLRV